MISGPVPFSQASSVAQYEIGDYRNFIYLILDWKTKKAAIVDPQRDLSEPLGDLEKNGFQLEAIFLTHTHHDHIAGVPELLKAIPDIRLVLHRKDAHRLPDSMTKRDQTELAEDRQETLVGNHRVELVHSPGHSAGGVCYFLKSEENFLFTGDTLFIRDCGRTDLETGSNEEMFASLQKLKKFPADTIILPGHHYAPEYSSSLALELKTSPPFQCSSVEELRSLP